MTDTPLPWRLRWGWAVGSLGTSTLHNGIGFLALFFLTEVLAIPPATAGTLLLAAKLYDLVTDPLAGVASDRTRTRHGRRRPWLLAGSLLGGLAFLAFFTTAPGAHAGGFALAGLLLYATAYTVFGVPYLAMPAEMTDEPHERSRLMAARTVCLSLGILAGGALAPVLVDAFGGGAQGFARMAWLVAPLVTASMGVTVIVTGGARATQAVAAPGARLGSALLEGLGNRPFAQLIACKFAHLVGVSVSMAALIFVVTRVLDRPGAALGPFVLASALGSIASLPLWLRLARRLGKRDTYWLAAAAYLPVLASWLAAHPGETDAVFWLRGLATGLATGGLTLTAQAMLPDAIAHDFERTGRRREAALAAVYSVAEKLAAACGPFVLGLVLDASGGSPGRILVGAVLLPAGATALSAVCLAGYRIGAPVRAA